jgi:hypothetical protein
LIRHGMPKDGREFWFMPVESFQFSERPDLRGHRLSRTFKPAGEAAAADQEGQGVSHGISEIGASETPQPLATIRQPPVDMGPSHEWGRYLVETTCTAVTTSLAGLSGLLA